MAPPRRPASAARDTAVAEVSQADLENLRQWERYWTHPITSNPQRLDFYVTGTYCLREASTSPIWLHVNQAGYFLVGWLYIQERLLNQFELRSGYFEAAVDQSHTGAFELTFATTHAADLSGARHDLTVTFTKSFRTIYAELCCIRRDTGRRNTYSLQRVRGSPNIPDSSLRSLPAATRAHARTPLYTSQKDTIISFFSDEVVELTRDVLAASEFGTIAGSSQRQAAISALSGTIFRFFNNFPPLQRPLVKSAVMKVIETIHLDMSLLDYFKAWAIEYGTTEFRRAADALGLETAHPNRTYRFITCKASRDLPIRVPIGLAIGVMRVQRGTCRNPENPPLEPLSDGFEVDEDCDWWYLFYGSDIGVSAEIRLKLEFLPRFELSQWSYFKTSSNWLAHNFQGVIEVLAAQITIPLEIAGVNPISRTVDDDCVIFHGDGVFRPIFTPTTDSYTLAEVSVGIGIFIGRLVQYSPDREDQTLPATAAPRLVVSGSEWDVVGFQTAAYQLSDAAMSAIRLLCARYRYFLERGSTKVDIVGRASRLGSAAANQVLSELRAKAVHQVMRDVLSDDPDSECRLFAAVTVKGEGEPTPPADDTNENDDSEWDRVVRVTLNGQHALSITEGRSP